MPGQRKRKSQRRHAAERMAARTSGPGRWEVVFETQSAAEWREGLRRLRTEAADIDWELTRIDTLCGRLQQPTTYRLSRFVPATGR
ncbi:hypothetical protein [Streptomyces sp. NPDC048172]|uniref:hypothetical protein n=1 Tax=Streptomyces sp. NPDC048172 TaxID=3365505 RepID=UPI0037112BF5